VNRAAAYLRSFPQSRISPSREFSDIAPLSLSLTFSYLFSFSRSFSLIPSINSRPLRSSAEKGREMPPPASKFGITRPLNTVRRILRRAKLRCPLALPSACSSSSSSAASPAARSASDDESAAPWSLTSHTSRVVCDDGREKSCALLPFALLVVFFRCVFLSLSLSLFPSLSLLSLFLSS